MSKDKGGELKDFQELEVWKRAHRLVLDLYRTSEAWPKSESFGLTHQTRRGATVLAARIAEGCGRDNNVEFAVELRRAKALASEFEYFVLLARDLGHLDNDSHVRLSGEVIEVRKMLSGLLRRL